MALVCLLFSCDYSPSGKHFEEIDPEPQIVAAISLNAQQDTVLVRGGTLLKFEVSMLGHKTFGYQIRFDKWVLEEAEGLPDDLWFVSTQFPDGYYTLQLAVLTTSGTGSLADKYKLEAAEVYRTWVVYIDNTPASPIAISSITPEDGRLKIEWQPYKRKVLNKFELYRSKNGYNRELLATFTNPAHTSWIDSTYVGGPVTYDVITYPDAYSYNRTYGPAYAYHLPLPSIAQSTFDKDNNLILSFNASPLYNNVKHYELSYTNGMHSESITVTDTVASFQDPGFGSNLELKLYTYPNIQPKNWSNNQAYTKTTVPGYGTAWGPYAGTLVPSPLTNLIYSFSYDYLKIIDASTLKVTHERDIRNLQGISPGITKTVLSKNGRQLYSLLNGVIHKLDPATLQTVETFSIWELLGTSSYSGLSLSAVSDNSRLLVTTINTWNYTSKVHVVDMALKKVVADATLTSYPPEAKISPDGNALKVGTTVLTAQADGSWQALSMSEQDKAALAFHPIKPWYAVKRSNSITFYAIASGAVERSVTTEAALTSYEIDAESGYLYGFANGMLYVYNIGTGQLKRKLKMAPSGTAFLYKNRIYSQDRYISL
ncbi:hypothetical protein GCM10028895_02210 [Pontibacter rugosus]